MDQVETLWTYTSLNILWTLWTICCCCPNNFWESCTSLNDVIILRFWVQERGFWSIIFTADQDSGLSGHVWMLTCSSQCEPHLLTTFNPLTGIFSETFSLVYGHLSWLALKVTTGHSQHQHQNHCWSGEPGMRRPLFCRTHFNEIVSDCVVNIYFVNT